MESKIKARTVNIALAIIGLIADAIGIFVFVFKANTSEAFSPGMYTIYIVLLIYGWFTLSWFLIRKFYRNQRNKGIKASNKSITSIIVNAIGIAFLPITSIVHLNTGGSILGAASMHLFLMACIYYTIMIFMRSIYEDSIGFVSRKGYYKCIIPCLDKRPGDIIKVLSKVPWYFMVEYETMDGKIENIRQVITGYNAKDDYDEFVITIDQLVMYFEPLTYDHFQKIKLIDSQLEAF